MWRSAVLFLFLVSGAGATTLDECFEGAEFIGNAALLRDSGAPEGSEESFVSRAIEDLEKIRSLPPDLRWFARDDESENFLLTEIIRVWREIQTPEQHYRGFLDRCISQ